ncbi:MAG: hypothetical protein P4L84_11270 [Isosphaeraceae bacterium]|nr:hypothetical protein [Isosphaeraceae bacterium]
MGKKKRSDIFDGEISVRIFDKAKAALEHIHTDLKRDARLEFQERPITQDALLLASWLWLEELGHEVVAEALARHIARLDKLAASRKAAASLSSDDTPASGSIVDEDTEGAGGQPKKRKPR